MRSRSETETLENGLVYWMPLYEANFFLTDVETSAVAFTKHYNKVNIFQEQNKFSFFSLSHENTLEY